MIKKIIALLTVCMLLLCTGCSTKTLHCDSCGTEIKTKHDSQVDESWVVYCEQCEKDKGLHTIIS